MPVKWDSLVGYRNISEPAIAVYALSKELANESAVIICPGGGYYFENVLPGGKLFAETWTKQAIEVIAK